MNSTWNKTRTDAFTRMILKMSLLVIFCLLSAMADAANPAHGDWRTNFSLVLVKTVLMEHEGKLTRVDASLFTYKNSNHADFLYLLRNGTNLMDATNDKSFLHINLPHKLNNLSIIKSEGSVNNYLTWMDGSIISLCKLPRSDSPSPRTGDMEFDFPSFWMADHYIDLSLYDGCEKLFMQENNYNLTVTNIAMTLDGLIFDATNGIGTPFKFLNKNKSWHIFDGDKEVRQIKPSPNRIAEVLEEKPTNTHELFRGTLPVKDKTGSTTNIGVVFSKNNYISKTTGWLTCVFQLETTNNRIALIRPVFDVNHAAISGGDCCSLVKEDVGNNYYLSWIDSYGRLCLTKPPNTETDFFSNDPTIGYFSSSPNDPAIRGGVDHTIDVREFNNWERFFKGGGGVASASQENNVLTLTVTNAAGSKFTFSNQDGQWHAYSFWGEISRVKTNP